MLHVQQMWIAQLRDNPARCCGGSHAKTRVEDVLVSQQPLAARLAAHQPESRSSVDSEDAKTYAVGSKISCVYWSGQAAGTRRTVIVRKIINKAKLRVWLPEEKVWREYATRLMTSVNIVPESSFHNRSSICFNSPFRGQRHSADAYIRVTNQKVHLTGKRQLPPAFIFTRQYILEVATSIVMTHAVPL